MTLDEIIKALEEVKHICQANPLCEHCPFDDKHSRRFITCLFGDYESPDLWSLDKIKHEERGTE